MRLILSLLLLQSTAFGAITINNIIGVSKTVRDTEGAWTVYGGIQVGESPGTYGCSDTEACDTCDGTVDIHADTVSTVSRPCNLQGVFTTTKVTFDIPVPSGATGRFYMCNGNAEIGSSTNLTVPLAVTWSSICQGASSGNTNCTTGVNQTFQVGISTTGCDSLGENKLSVKFISRGVDKTTSNTYTPAATPACTSDYGACFFKVFPGDAKVYMDDIGIGSASNWPATETSAVKYANVVLFFETTGTAPDDASNDVSTYPTVNTSKSFGRIPISSTDGSLTGSFIDGLDNEVRYCFKMGSEDEAGNIDRISATDCSAANIATCPNVCMAPSEVMGLLADKKCFIATAAYGSQLDSHVNLLREFRNEFMVKNWLGRRLVKTYYKFSPPLAKWIERNESAKTVVRGVLWPIIAWASLSLSLGWFGVLLPFLFVGVLIYARRKWKFA